MSAQREKDLFLAASELPADQRAAYLNRECGDDAELRRRVEVLLAAHDASGSYLASPDPKTGAYCPEPTDALGFVIAGRYKLLEQIGEGGMGTVWIAEQTQPVRRKVALKLIKAGMDSKSVISRFEAERQALALMDHPNIAKVLDGGTTENGRPFFVMEYVKGVPFTKYCDDARLSVAERLALFVPVCQAVQHAHQKGVIHRDLKPSNILVCLYDGKPVPKVIDFGLAKAIHQPLTEHTLHTAHGAMMGTPLYMSPEQAEFNNLDVDTRTDIYALGVILYELLTGTTPLEKQRFQQAAWHEMLRLIKEEEPPRPSARLSGSGSLPSLAAQRQLEPIKLARLVRGELDWIVMKCLEKERSRRYDTATGLARDVERYLADELVEARPPTAGYQLRKFVRRHKTAIATVMAFAGLLVVAVVASTWLGLKAKGAAEDAKAKRIEADANAKEAQQYADAWSRESEQRLEAVVDAEIRNMSLKIDVDLAEVRTDPKVGLLRLARPMKDTYGPLRVTGPNFKQTMTGSFDRHPRFVELREFATAAVLAAGQPYAPLLPPITHDGTAVADSTLNSKGDRLLTRGTDKTARLWDAFTGRQMAVLRRKDEIVFEAGMSPDGATAFTHSLDGVVRFWETKDGSFRAETEARPKRIQFVNFGEPNSWEKMTSLISRSQLTNDRLMTHGVIKLPYVRPSAGEVELWDTKTGRFIAHLDQPSIDVDTYRLFGNGRWISAQERTGQDRVLHIFASENGQHLAKLSHAEKGLVSLEIHTSPSGQTLATITGIGRYPDDYYVQLWDTTSWKLLSKTGPLKWGALDPAQFQLIADDRFAMYQINGTIEIFQAGATAPIAELPGPTDIFQGESLDLTFGDGVALHLGQLYDSRSWRRLQPPKGRKYHPKIIQFAPDGRFVPGSGILDTTTEKTFEGSRSSFYQPKLGWVMGTELHRLPPLDHLNIPPEMLELWTQVAVRGQLDDEGAFVPWDEPTWEKKRQELAAKPAPYPDFPFPGHVAVDRLHWLRQEYLTASDANKPGLAKQLLDRAEAIGDRAEAVRWRAIVTPTKPGASK